MPARVLEASAEAGVTFFDTADVYGDGRSEQLVGASWPRTRTPGSRSPPRWAVASSRCPEHYTLANFRAWIDRSRRNLGMDTLDLVQLHCPPTRGLSTTTRRTTPSTRWSTTARSRRTASASRPSTRRWRRSRARSVAIVQIILNAFRLKPLEQVLPAAAEAGVGIIARVPLASGLLTGRYDATPRSPRTTTAPTTATAAPSTWARPSRASTTRPGWRPPRSSPRSSRDAPAGVTPAQAAIAWVWQQPGVTTVIPGARNAEQARANAAAGDVAPARRGLPRRRRAIYDDRVRAAVHDRW